MQIDKPINFYPTTKDILVWQGYDFTLPYFTQYEYTLAVGLDLGSYPTIPDNVKEPENIFTRYAPFDWLQGYFTFTINNGFECDSDIFSESAELAVFAKDCGTYTTSSLLEKNGLQGKFAMIAREIIDGSFQQMSKEDTFPYLIAYLPQCVTSNFDFDEGSYTLKFTTNGDADEYTLLDGSIKVIKQGAIL